jgi:hypothetical protein
MKQENYLFMKKENYLFNVTVLTEAGGFDQPPIHSTATSHKSRGAVWGTVFPISLGTPYDEPYRQAICNRCSHHQAVTSL